MADLSMDFSIFAVWVMFILRLMWYPASIGAVKNLKMLIPEIVIVGCKFV